MGAVEVVAYSGCMSAAARQRGQAETGVLVILPTWVGDFVMATPFLRAIRRRFDGAQITFLIEPNLCDLAVGGEWMDDCLLWPDRAKRRPWNRDYLKLVADLRRHRLDWAIILPNSFRSALIARLSGARRRIGYDRDGRGWLLTDRVAVKNRHRITTSEPRTDDSDGHGQARCAGPTGRSAVRAVRAAR